jgi:aminoglycoside phosphotransferase (APT) family kinase protein
MGALPKMNLWLQRKIDGVVLTSILGQPEGKDAMRQAAHAIHKLNEQGPATNRRHTLDDEMALLRERLTHAATQIRPLSKRILTVLDRCHTLAGTLAQAAPRPIHREFCSDNLLIAPNGVYLLDLDLYCQGDPALDVGNFLGRLTEFSLRTYQDPYRLRPHEKAFQLAYLELAGDASRRSVEVYKTLTLARLIQISTLITPRRAYTEAILVLCERRLRNHP